MDTLAEINSLKISALAELAKTASLAELEAWRVTHLGKKSAVNTALKSLATLPIEERKMVGAAANEARVALEAALADKEKTLDEADIKNRTSAAGLDITLPGRPWISGRLHPISRVIQEISDIFGSLGFSIIEGPEVETDYYNFEALNIPKEHPARDNMQTFWLDELNNKGERNMLLRTHTSPMQVRFMEKQKPPIRIIVPGRVFRYEATD